MIYIFILDYTEGKVYKSKLKKKYIEDPEEFLLNEGFNLDNIHFMTTTKKSITKILSHE